MFFQNVWMAISLARISLADFYNERIPNTTICACLLVRIGALCWKERYDVLWDTLLAGVGMLIFMGVCVGIGHLFKREAVFGGGDLKLCVIFALYIGFFETLFVLFCSFCTILPVAVWKRRVVLGPILCFFFGAICIYSDFFQKIEM